MKQKGFTVIELLFVVVLLAGASILFFVQKSNIQTAAADNQRKTAINAMYYSLEEVYYPAHKAYPQTVDEKVLPSVDPSLFTDPNGKKIGDGQSNYSYKPTNCNDGQCQSYTLQATLQNEADYVKTNRSH
jgi:prepilin-type N-terminal cleavage/methylation domain-containing protein